MDLKLHVSVRRGVGIYGAPRAAFAGPKAMNCWLVCEVLVESRCHGPAAIRIGTGTGLDPYRPRRPRLMNRPGVAKAGQLFPRGMLVSGLTMDTIRFTASAIGARIGVWLTSAISCPIRRSPARA